MPSEQVPQKNSGDGGSGSGKGLKRGGAPSPGFTDKKQRMTEAPNEFLVGTAPADLWQQHDPVRVGGRARNARLLSTENRGDVYCHSTSPHVCVAMISVPS